MGVGRAGRMPTWADGRTPERLPRVVWQSPLVELEHHQALLHLPTIGRFFVPLDGLPTVERYAGADRSDVECVVEGPVRALQGLMGGHFALRGSAVLANGEAVVITGNSGVGKSALAAALMRSGASVLADGYVFVDAGCPPTLQVTRGRVDLWPDTVMALGLGSARGELVRAALGKRAFIGPSACNQSHVPVRSLVILTAAAAPTSSTPSTKARYLEVPAAVRALASLGYLRQAIAPLGASHDHFRWLASLVSLRPVDLCRPRGDMAQSLEALASAVQAG